MTGLLLTCGLALGLAFAEAGLGLGIVLPGETAVVVLAATARSAHEVVLLGLAVTVGACAGDHVGYLVGRRYGDALRESRVVVRLGRHHHDRATALLRRHGGWAVLVTRLLPVVRTLTPAAAGASGLAYRTFLPASLAGSALWAAAYVGGGSVVASAASAADGLLGRASWLLAVVAAVVVLPVLLVRALTGTRPGVAAPEVARLELDGPPRHRRAPFSPLIGDVQV